MNIQEYAPSDYNATNAQSVSVQPKFAVIQDGSNIHVGNEVKYNGHVYEVTNIYRRGDMVGVEINNDNTVMIVKPEVLMPNRKVKTESKTMKTQELRKLVREEVKKALKETSETGLSNYMFFEDLQSIKRMAEKLLALDSHKVDELICNGHDWAEEHVAVAKSKLGDVTGFLMNQFEDSTPALVGKI
jgi:hypothetical protein